MVTLSIYIFKDKGILMSLIQQHIFSWTARKKNVMINRQQDFGGAKVEGLKKCLEQAGISQWGICRYTDVLPLLNVRSKTRVPEDAKSIIVLLFGYYIGDYSNRNISRYAIVDDYHSVIKSILEDLSKQLEKMYKNDIFIPFVDSSPISEVRAACLAGLGDVGMNGQLLNAYFGSYCFIGEIITNMDLAPNECKAQKLCTRCGQCILACPTGALRVDGFDKEKCRSHITQKKGVLSDWEREQIRLGGFVWGCDRCTDCCPVNRNAHKSEIEAFYQDIEPVVGQDNLASLCKTKAYGWRGQAVLQRNLDILSETVL